VTSARKIAANRSNARKSRGPQTAAGKFNASRNALRHGLSAVTQRNSVRFAETERIAMAICSGESDPLLFEQALVIAESEVLLRSVRAERVAMIERLHDGTAIALAKGDNSMALAKARLDQGMLAFDELDRIRIRLGLTNDGLPIWTPELEDRPLEPGWRPAPPKIRDEVDAFFEALPDLERLDRYERRAWSRRKRAIRNFMEIKSMGVAPRAMPSNGRQPFSAATR
jgi:hypothetical protein